MQSSANLTKQADKIIDLFRSIHKEFKTQMIKQVCDCGFTVPQILLMHELYHNPGISLNELSKRLSLSKSTVSGIVDRLEKQGYVLREIPENNRRTVKISLEPEIIEKQEQFKNIKTKYLTSILCKLSEEEVEDILISLERFERLFKED